MKTYKSSDLTHKRAEVFKAAREHGVIVEQCRSNGEVEREYILIDLAQVERIDYESGGEMRSSTGGKYD